VVQYDKFARVYATGHYPGYSLKMAELLPDMLAKFSFRPETVLDIACGEGAFAVSLAKIGYEVTGYDASEEMLKWARERASREEVDVNFIQGDMRDIPFKHDFDLVTSWYDSINYLLEQRDLEKTFDGVFNSLRDNGAFIFDINTIRSLSVDWQETQCYVQRNDEEIFEVHRTNYKKKKKIANLHITAFLKEENGWERIDETHKERAYPLEILKNLLFQSGFDRVSLFDDPFKFTSPEEDSSRVWFVAIKQE